MHKQWFHQQVCTYVPITLVCAYSTWMPIILRLWSLMYFSVQTLLLGML